MPRPARGLTGLGLAILIATTLAATPVRPPAPGWARVDPALLEASGEVELYVHGDSTDAAVHALGAVGVEAGIRLDAIAAVRSRVPAGRVAALSRQPGVVYLERFVPDEFHTPTSMEAVRAEEVRAAPWEISRADGRGISIAILDTGIDGTHPMFVRDGASKVRRSVKNFCWIGTDIIGPEACVRDVPTGDSDTLNAGGHGTHVAGIAAGYQTTVDEGVIASGVAGGAALIDVAIALGPNTGASDVGFQWVLDHHRDPCGDRSCPPIRVVNASFGRLGGGPYDPDSAQAKLAAELVERGIVIAWSAGNDGGDGSSDVTNPMAKSPVPGVISVAAYDDANQGTRDGVVAEFSSRGDREDQRTWPDVSAPGAQILSACRAQLPLCTSFDPYRDYGSASGTSMAAPHVAGAAAVLLSADRGMTPAQVESIIESTAHRFDGPTYQTLRQGSRPDDDGISSPSAGHGLLDLAAAVDVVLGTDLAAGVAVRCPTAPVAYDQPGDALPFVAPPPGPAGWVDVTSFALQPTDTALEVEIRVRDIPDGSVSPHSYEWEFRVGSDRYVLVIERRPGSAPLFELTTSSMSPIPLDGEFDAAADVVRTTVDASALEVVRAKSGDHEIAPDSLLTSRGAMVTLYDTVDVPCPVVLPSD